MEFYATDRKVCRQIELQAPVSFRCNRVASVRIDYPADHKLYPSRTVYVCLGHASRRLNAARRRDGHEPPYALHLPGWDVEGWPR